MEGTISIDELKKEDEILREKEQGITSNPRQPSHNHESQTR